MQKKTISRKWTAIKKRALTGLLAVLVLSQNTAAQNTDSLIAAWNNNTLADTIRIKAVFSVAWNYVYTNPDSAAILANAIYDLAEKKNLEKWKYNSLYIIGASCWARGNYEQALEYYNRSLMIVKKLGDKKGESNTLNNIGVLYQSQGDYPNAINNFLKCLRVFEEIHDTIGQASSYNNIGLIHQAQHDHKNALFHYNKALVLFQSKNDAQGQSNAYGNIGSVYMDQQNYFESLKFNFKSLCISEELGDLEGQATSLGNIGSIHFKQGHHTIALEHFEKSLTLFHDLRDLKGLSGVLNRSGQVYLADKNYLKSKELYLKSYEYSSNAGALHEKKEACECLYTALKNLGDSKTSLAYFEQFVALRDTLLNEERTREITQKEFQFAYDKKSNADSIHHSEQQKIKDIEISRQTAIAEKERTQKSGVFGGLAIVAILSVIIFNRLRVTRKQKSIIENQKLLVEEKQKEILDSINYARRIQKALLKDDIFSCPDLPPHFILYKPKDIVSGDFYWCREKENYLYLAVADCTGHGVPGAFMSMLGITFLNEALSNGNLPSPAELLDKTRRRIIHELSQTGKNGESKDGMDISLARLNLQNNVLEWAGANNPLWVVHHGELIELKPDKQPVGYFPEQKPFTNHSLNLRKEDQFFLFSDGYADQFGGERGGGNSNTNN